MNPKPHMSVESFHFFIGDGIRSNVVTGRGAGKHDLLDLFILWKFYTNGVKTDFIEELSDSFSGIFHRDMPLKL